MKDKLTKLLRVRSYVNDERFKKICEEKRIANSRDLWDKMNASFLYFLTLAPEELIDGLTELDDKIQEQNILKLVFEKDTESLKKIVFEDGTTLEINISSVEGLENLVNIYKTQKVEYLLPLVDTLSEKTKTHIFEGDIIKCYDEWHNKTTKIILACMDKQYINPDPYYVELLYTEKYGYLNSKGNANKDTEALQLKESIFNMKPGRMNYHCITLTKQWEVIGNIYVNYNVLNPISHE